MSAKICEDSLRMGTVGNIPVDIFREDLANGILVAVGQSGYGKTNALKGLIYQQARKHTVIIPDTSDSFDGIELHHEAETTVIDVYLEGIGIQPLKPMIFDTKHIEKDAEVAARFADTMTNIYKLGQTQSLYLHHALKGNIQSAGSTNEKLISCCQYLQAQEGESVAKLCSKLEQLTDLQIFSDKETFSFGQLSGRGIILIKMNHFSMQIKRLIVELLLWEVWRLFQENKDSGCSVTLVLDECQTLNFSNSSPVTKMLTEGRKFGINCWLATQFLNGNFNTAAISRLEQAATKLYFKPANGDLKYIVGKLPGDKKKEWLSILTQLEIGTLVLSAPYRIKGKRYIAPITVKTELMQTE